MNDFLFWACVLGPVLLAEGLLARYEVLAYSAGFRSPTTALPEGVPYARGAAADRPPGAYLVYLDGIGKRRVRDTRDGGQLVKAVIAGAPELRVLGQVQPYSPLADPLADRPVWASRKTVRARVCVNAAPPPLHGRRRPRPVGVPRHAATESIQHFPRVRAAGWL